MKYEVDIKKIELIEPYEQEQNNVMHVYAQKKINIDSGTKYKIVLSLSKNAMLGLGKELIRYAYLNRKPGHHVHLEPIEPGKPQVQAMGIYLLPASIPGIVGHGEFGDIISILQESEMGSHE